MTKSGCPNCGGKIPKTRNGSMGRPALYCSRSCGRAFNEKQRTARYLEQNPDIIRNCVTCGVEFHTRMKSQRFCSYDCRQAGYRVEGFAKRAETKKTSYEYDCDMCGEKIIRSIPLGGKRRYHPDCAKKSQQANYRKKTVKRQGIVKPAYIWHELVLETYGFICYLCDSPIDMKLPRTSKRGATIDHVVPISRGGVDELENLRLVHWECNNRKSNKLVEEL